MFLRDLGPATQLLTVVYWGWGFFQMQLGWRLQPFKHFKPKPGFREHLEQTFHQFGFCENWWLEPPKMEPWKMIGFGRDTHVNHDYLQVTSSSRAVHFIGQPKIQNIFDSEKKSTDSKVAPPGRNKTRNYHICPEPQGELGFNEGECCFNWKRLKTVRRGPKRDPILGDVCIHVCHFLTQEMMTTLIYVYLYILYKYVYIKIWYTT